MKLTFDAKYVSFSEALDGDLLQLTFDTIAFDADEDARVTPYVHANRLFEFPGPATFEWHDGTDYHGEAEVVSAALSRNRLSIRLDRPFDIDVGFQISDRKHKQLWSCLKSMLGPRIFLTDQKPEPADRSKC